MQRRRDKFFGRWSQQSGMTMAGAIISAGVFAFVVIAVTRFSSQQRATQLAYDSRNNTSALLALIHKDLANRFAVHRKDEVGQVVAPCNLPRRFFNFLPRPDTECTASSTQAAELLTIDPGSPTAQTTFTAAQRFNRSSKLVLENRTTSGNVRRTEYETVCVAVPVDHPYRALDFGRAAMLENTLVQEGCFATAAGCNISANSIPAILIREHSNWDDANDLNPNFDWNAGTADLRRRCLPSNLFEPNNAGGCSFRLGAQLQLASQPIGTALCSWTDDLDDPNVLSVRAWGIYAGPSHQLSVLRENINLFRDDLTAGAGGPVGNGGPGTEDLGNGGPRLGHLIVYASGQKLAFRIMPDFDGKLEQTHQVYLKKTFGNQVSKDMVQNHSTFLGDGTVRFQVFDPANSSDPNDDWHWRAFSYELPTTELLESVTVGEHYQLCWNDGSGELCGASIELENGYINLGSVSIVGAAVIVEITATNFLQPLLATKGPPGSDEAWEASSDAYAPAYYPNAFINELRDFATGKSTGYMITRYFKPGFAAGSQFYLVPQYSPTTDHSNPVTVVDRSSPANPSHHAPCQADTDQDNDMWDENSSLSSMDDVDNDGVRNSQKDRVLHVVLVNRLASGGCPTAP